MNEYTMLEDVNKWSDEENGFMLTENVDNLSLTITINGQLAENDQALVPGSIVIKNTTTTNLKRVEFRASHIYAIMLNTHCILISKLVFSVTHERYRLTAIEQAMGDDISDDLASGVVKPWQKPMAWMMDGTNIVYFRESTIEEDWIKEHSGDYCYKSLYDDDPVKYLHYNGEPIWDCIDKSFYKEHDAEHMRAKKSLYPV